MSVASFLLDLFYPPRCVLCGKLLERGERNFHTACRLRLPVCGERRDAGPYISAAAAALYYRDEVRESLLRFKFQGKSLYAGSYGPMIAAAAGANLPMTEVDAVTWIPVSRRRLRERGYDQAELLARSAAKALDKPVEAMLDKFRDNPPQSSLDSAEARRANVLGVYRVKKGAAVAGKTCLLIDDILTTGATASEAARVLLTAGAAGVYFAAVATGHDK